MGSNKIVRAVVIGAGNRGKDVYAKYALDHPNELKIIAVAEPNADQTNQNILQSYCEKTLFS